MNTSHQVKSYHLIQSPAVIQSRDKTPPVRCNLASYRKLIAVGLVRSHTKTRGKHGTWNNPSHIPSNFGINIWECENVLRISLREGSVQQYKILELYKRLDDLERMVSWAGHLLWWYYYTHVHLRLRRNYIYSTFDTSPGQVSTPKPKRCVVLSGPYFIFYIGFSVQKQLEFRRVKQILRAFGNLIIWKRRTLQNKAIAWYNCISLVC